MFKDGLKAQKLFRRKHMSESAADKTALVFVLLLVVLVVFPLLWTLVSSLKGNAELRAYPPTFIPERLSLEHYETQVFSSRIPVMTWNSAYVGVLTVIISLLVGAHAGYALARFEFAGKGAILLVLLATQMIPGIALLVPYYLIATKVGLFNTHSVLVIIYTAWQGPVVAWIMKSFFDNIPKELEEAAFVDGCGKLEAFYRIVLPVSRPGLAAAAIITFVYVWNEFLIAYTLTISGNKRLLTTGLYLFRTQTGVEWGPLMASLVLGLLPITVLFFALHRSFMEGLTSGSVKG